MVQDIDFHVQHRVAFCVVHQNVDAEITDPDPGKEILPDLSLEQMMGKAPLSPGWKAIHKDGSVFQFHSYPDRLVFNTKQARPGTIIGFLNSEMGILRWIRIDVIPEFMADSQTLSKLISTIRDVSDEKEALDLAKKRNRYFHVTFDRAPIGIAHVALDGSWLKVNQYLCKFLGYFEEELQSLSFQDVTYPDDLSTDMDLVHQMITGEIESYTLEKRYIQKSGQIVWANLTVSLVRYPDGSPDHFISIVENIDRRKRIELELQETQSQYEQILNAIDDLILVKGAHSRILWANQAFQAYYSMSNEQLAGLIDAPFAEPDFTEQYVIDDANVFNSGKTLHIPEEPVKRYDGTTGYFNTVKSAIFDQSGQVVKTVGVSRDISARKQVEKQILNLNDELKQQSEDLRILNQELNAFAYSVSHDLRTPLRAMTGFARILQSHYSEHLPDKGFHYVERIAAGAERMGYLIDDLLDFSRIGRQSVKKQTVVPDNLIQQVLQDLLPAHTDRKIEIRQDPLPPCYADPGLLRLVYLNLLTNALKFTKDEEIAQIHIGYLQEDSDEAVYFVQDNGVGFEMQYVNKIFGVFQRLHKQEDFEGTGVGLATVQRIIHKHGGQIKAVAEIDKGATIYFSLPSMENTNEPE